MYFQYLTDLILRNGFVHVRGKTSRNVEESLLYERGRLGLILNGFHGGVHMYVKGDGLPYSQQQLTISTELTREEREESSELLGIGMTRMVEMCRRFPEKSLRLLSERIPDYKSFLYLVAERLSSNSSDDWESHVSISKKEEFDTMRSYLFYSTGDWNWGLRLKFEDERLVKYGVCLIGTSIGYTNVSIERKGIVPVLTTPREEFTRALEVLDNELRSMMDGVDFTWRA